MRLQELQDAWKNADGARSIEMWRSFLEDLNS